MGSLTQRREIRRPWLVLAALMVAGCHQGLRTVEIPIHPQPGRPAVAVVRMDVPKDWQSLTPSASRVEYVAPDRQARSYFRMMKGAPDETQCESLSRAYAKEFIESWGPGTKVASREARGPVVDFQLKRTQPKPAGERIWSKVVCRHGVLALASCTVTGKLDTDKPNRCPEVISYFDILPPR